MTDRIIGINHLNRDLTVRSDFCSGGVTIAQCVDVFAQNGKSFLVLHMAIAVCNENEQFVRRVGKELATARLLAHLEHTLPTQFSESFYLGMGNEDLDALEPHQVPFAYQDGKPYILNTYWNTLGFCADRAEDMLAKLHFKLA